MRKFLAAAAIMLSLMAPFWFLAYCYTQMAGVYEFLDSESYRLAMRKVENAERAFKRAEQKVETQGEDPNEHPDVLIAQYRLAVEENALSRLRTARLTFYASKRASWQTPLYREDWPVCRTIVWLVETTSVSVDYAVVVPLLVVGLMFYGGWGLILAYSRHSVRRGSEFDQFELESS